MLRRASILPLLASLLAAPLGCADGPESAEQEQNHASELSIVPLDIWAQPLPDGYTIGARANGAPLDTKTADDGAVRIPLKKGLTVLSISAPDHEDLQVAIRFDGVSDPEIDDELTTSGHGLSFGHRAQSGKRTHRLFVGLRHGWFSAEGRPARRGNELDLMVSGEEAWKSVHEELTQATSEVLVSTWWWESDFELVRPEGFHQHMSEAERRKNTILGVLEARPAQKRVLVGQLWGQDGVLSGLTVDDALTTHGELGGDKFELMGQANPTRGRFTFQVPDFTFAPRVLDEVDGADAFDLVDGAPVTSTVPEKEVDLTKWPVEIDTEHASYHQKFLVVDHEVAFVGGMNLRKVDWDTEEHAVFEPRRMSFDATAEEREAVAAKESLPDNGPRKDYMVRIDGPAAQDVASVFHKRWTLAREEGVEYAANTTEFEVKRDIGAHEGGVQAQVTATLPEPIAEHAIVETWLNAVARAERYVFIEDQYFRAPMLNDALLARMKEVPDLRLVVITKPINEWTDPGCAHTYESARLFAEAFPDRFLFLQLRSFDTQVVLGFDETDAHFVDMDVHSKMFIVDDRFLSVGSCNKNNRGIIYEGELNVAVLDDAWVKAARRRVLAGILGASNVSDDAAGWFDQLRAAAAANDAVHALWDDEGFDLDLDGSPLPNAYRPKGFVYSLPYGDVSDCLLESVGEDMTGDDVPEGPPGEVDGDADGKGPL
jgi:phosphatidylserine/phosphatidylglycerophosphate/cardiolipin synthase-like enzyme